MSGPLAGRTVIVTRPAHQAGPILDALHSAGARCVALPGLIIEPVPIPDAERERLAPDKYDWAVFTSTNAVAEGLRQLSRPTRCRIAAIGRATARALIRQGLQVDAQPVDGADSEALLALPQFQHIGGQKVLLLRGIGGRERLYEELLRRGATVEIAQLYRRRPAVASASSTAELTRAFADEGEPIVMVTSVEVLRGLLGMTPEHWQDRLRAAPLVVPGTRVAAAALELGWTGRITVATSAEDEAMMGAISGTAQHDTDAI